MAKKVKVFGIVLAVLIFFSFLIMQTVGMIFDRKKSAEQTSIVLLDQIEKIMEENEKFKKEISDVLDEDFISHTYFASHIISLEKVDPQDYKKIIQIADLINVEEINLFNAQGKLFGGTNPDYYGLDFDSNSQLQYFKPMLNDKNLRLIQPVSLNYSDEQNMVYTMVWTADGQMLVQTGIPLERIHLETFRNDIAVIAKSVPVYRGINIYIGDFKTRAIIGSNSNINRETTFINIGFKESLFKENLLDEPVYVTQRIENKKCYCVLKKYNNYVIAISQRAKVVNSGTLKIIFIMSLYVLAVVITVICFIRRINNGILSERRLLRLTKIDELSGLLNRRAYDEALSKFYDRPIEEDFVIVSADVNGLKYVNDNYGHDAGDELITGAARCLNDVFGHYGQVYRTGGDEFIAMLKTDVPMEDFLKRITEFLECWHGKLIDEISVSVGYACKKDYPDADIRLLSKISDEKMYEAKRRYYQIKGKDRRNKNRL